MSSRRSSIRLVTVLIALVAALALPSPARAGQVTVEGRLDVFHADFFRQNRSTHDYFLRTGEERLALRFPDQGPHQLAAARVRVTGNREGNVITVPSSRPPHVERIDGGSSGADGTGVAALAPGARDTLVILIDFTDTSPVPADPAVMRDETFLAATSVASYYNEISFGQTTLQGDVTAWLPINDSSSPCDYDAWGQAARTAASAAGWALSNYEHIVHYFSQPSACGWSGLGELGGRFTWINGTYQDSPADWNELVIAHEIGHNLTLHHSGDLECSAGGVRVALSSSCTHDEYGDLFDVMGNGYHHFNSFHKAHLGWIPSGNVATVTSGNHTLSAMESACSSCVQVLRIPRGSEYLYVEYRQPFGFDNFAATNPVVNGASLRLAPDYPLNNQRTRLIDTEPTTNTVQDGALAAGNGFADGSGILVETLTVAPGSLTVRVRTGFADPSPSANIGTAHSVPINTFHTHGGATAADTGSNLMSYQWRLSRCGSWCSSLTNATGSLNGGSSTIPGPTFRPTKKGRFKLSLTVYDTLGKSVTVTVEERAV